MKHHLTQVTDRRLQRLSFRRESRVQGSFLLVSISYVHVRLRVMHPKRVDRSFEFLIMIVFNVIINYQ